MKLPDALNTSVRKKNPRGTNTHKNVKGYTKYIVHNIQTKYYLVEDLPRRIISRSARNFLKPF